MIPLRSVAPEIPVVPPEGAEGDQPAMEREEGDIVTPEREVAPTSPTEADQGSQPGAPPVPPAGGELAVGADLMVQPSAHQCSGRATLAPDPQKATGSSSSAQDLETASINSPGWTPESATIPRWFW